MQREEGVPKNHGATIPQKDDASKATSEHEKSGKGITLTPPDTHTGFQESDSVGQGGCTVRSYVSSNTVTAITPATSSDLTFLDSMLSDVSTYDSSYPILDIDALDVSTDPYPDDTLSPIGSSGTRATADDDSTNTGAFPGKAHSILRPNHQVILS